MERTGSEENRATSRRNQAEGYDRSAPTTSQRSSPTSEMFPRFVMNEKASSSDTSKANTLNSSRASITNDLLDQLHTFYKDQAFTDAEIHIQGLTIKAHRVVLATQSDYFKAMFSMDLSEKHSGKVQLHDLDAIAVKQLVDFAYSHKIEPGLTTENVQPLLHAASILQFKKVLMLCSKFIGDNMDPENTLCNLRIAHHFGLQDLLERVYNFVARNFHVVMLNGAEFLEPNIGIPPDAMKLGEMDLDAIFSDPEIIVRNESVILDVLFTWGNVDINEKNESENDKLESVVRILTHSIRLPFIPASMLYKMLNSDALLSIDSGNRLRSSIQDSLICQLSPEASASIIGTERSLILNQRRSCAKGAVFCVGGRQASSDPFRSAEVYDVMFDRWMRIPDLNYRRRHVGLAMGSKNGKRGLFAVGGHDGTRHLDTVEVLWIDPSSKWRTVSSLNTLRRGLAVSTVESPDSRTYLFAIGGLDDQTCFDFVEIYDSETDEWLDGPRMSQPRGGVAAATLQSKVFAVGGNDGNYSVDTGEVLDPIAAKWSNISKMRHRRAGAGLATVNNCLWVAGGFDENVPLDAVEFYDPRMNVWQRGPQMQTQRGGVGLVSMGNQLYAVGGHDGSDYLASVECFDARMFMTNFSNSNASRSLSPSSAYSSAKRVPQDDIEQQWLYVASLSNGRAGAGLVHVPDVIPLYDLPVGNDWTLTSSANQFVADL